MLTNRKLSASEAAEWGLVTEVVDGNDLQERTDALAQQLAAGALQSGSAVKKLLLASFTNGLEEQMEWEGRMIAACADAADGSEGVNAFLEKRKPEFA
jgi:2-(1,2-epoxy-1,2-dihydrophenyl)acetyl-CoA isomerase